MKQIEATPSLGFGDAVKSSLNRLTDFKGRTRRSEFWWTILAYYICVLIINLILGMILPQTALTIIGIILQFLVFGATVRRLHDTGRSGWWVGVSWIVSIISSIYVMANSDILMSVNINPEEIMEFASAPATIGITAINTILNIIVIIFCLLDSKAETNKYGESPKYKETEE